jgi:hypothetical protein
MPLILFILLVVFMVLWAVALFPAGGPLSVGGRWFAWISVLLVIMVVYLVLHARALPG